MTPAREVSTPAEEAAILAMIDSCFSPSRPLIVSPAVYAEAMKDPRLAARADRMKLNLPLPA